ncbi:MAG: serine hydrolase domain-containing protein [Acidimicrobiales bacterium]
MSALDTVAGWPVERAAVGVTRPDAIVEAVGEPDEPFALASVTKLFSAYAVLVAIEEGTVGLDEPAGPDGSTVRHLLAHASGLPPEAGGPVGRVGVRRIYSNLGFEVLGATVEERSGMSFADYLHEAVSGPLALTSFELAGSPASGGSCSLADLLAFARELLDPAILSPATVAEATTVAFPGLSGVLPGFGRQDPNDWGLGFELRDHKSPHWTGSRNSPAAFGHFGRSGTFLWVDPEIEIACAALTNRDFGPWAVEVWPALSNAVVAEFSVR